MGKSLRNIIFAVVTTAVVGMVLTISINGFFTGDDYAMRMGNNHSLPARVLTLGQAIQSTFLFYKTWGGGLFAAFCQFVFCGIFGDNKLWFDIFNVLMFALTIVICVGFMDSKGARLGYAAMFALLLWFLLPQPHETLFWVTGSIAYMWGTVPCLLFLLLFLRYKDANLSIREKGFFFCLSLVSATSLIFSVSVCGALVISFLFKIKQLRGNTLLLVIGFVIGTLVLLLAPGNFVRAESSQEMFGLDSRIDVLKHPLRELFRYRALPLFVFAILICLVARFSETIKWVKDNSILMLALMWSVVAFSIVFRPQERAMFTTEILAMILFVRLLSCQVINWTKLLPCVVIMFFFVFAPDAYKALQATKEVALGNEIVMKQLVEQDGIAYANDMTLGHGRMALRRKYDSWAFVGMADALGLNNVCIIPEFCNPDLWPLPANGCEIQKEVFYKEADGVGIVCVRLPEQCDTTGMIISVEYTKDNSLLRKIRARTIGYNYNKKKVLVLDQPFARHLGYSYYFVFISYRNAQNLTKFDVLRDQSN